jgi:hypothetical protein
MAQKRKKKKTQSSHQPLSAKYLFAKASYEKARTVTGKVLRAYGFAPDLFDSFPRMQRLHMFYVRVEPLRFRAKEGQTIPRRLINFVAESTHHFMRTHYFGDESIGLTLLELSTCGMSLACVLEVADTSGLFQPEQLKVIATVAKTINQKRIFHDIRDVGTYIRKMMLMVSKVNFRIYGFNWIQEPVGENSPNIRATIFLSSEESVSIRFRHRLKEQTAFRVRAGQVITEPPRDATIDRWFIFHREEFPYVYLDIYIHSHVLQRVKERMDIFPAHKRNYYVMEPLLYMHRVAFGPSKRPMLACYFKDGNRLVYLGYYPFTIRKNKLIVTTFLPLASAETPTGANLQSLLGLQEEDVTLLGMDRLSFYLTVDFEQIPILKDALIATEIWDLVQYAANNPEMNFTIDREKTQMVKEFFEHKIPSETPPQRAESLYALVQAPPTRRKTVHDV